MNYANDESLTGKVCRKLHSSHFDIKFTASKVFEAGLSSVWG